MRLIYFDEVKYHPPKQPKFWIGALSINSEAIADIEARINSVAERFFESKLLTRTTEFHAVDMVQGNSHFKGRTIAERLDAFEELLSIASDERIRRISVSVDPNLMVAPVKTAQEKAFVFFVEKSQQDLTKARDTGILVGDLDTTYADEGVLNLSRYRENGTPYFFGRPIDRIIDSVYFIQSHHSRLVQLADAYTYILQLISSPPDGDNYPRKRLREYVSTKTSLSWANSYKDWPTSDSWMFSGVAA